MNNINGFIEIDGVIHKIASVDDFKRAAESIGKEFSEMSRDELLKLCNIPDPREGLSYSELVSLRNIGKCDDCGVIYKNGVLLFSNRHSNDSIPQYKVKNGTKAINKYAFYFNYRKYHSSFNDYWRTFDIIRLYLPPSILAIGDSAFRCNAMEEIIFSDSIRYIGAYAFSGCSNLKISKLPKELRELGGNAFEGCNPTRNVVFSNSIKEIGSHAFKGCESLESVYIPDSVEVVGSSIFEDCPNIKNIFIPKGSMEKFKELFPFDNDKLSEVDKAPTFED